MFSKLLLIGCEPADLGDPDEGKMGLSDIVAAAVNETPRLLESLLREHFAGQMAIDLASASGSLAACSTAATSERQ